MSKVLELPKNWTASGLHRDIDRDSYIVRFYNYKSNPREYHTYSVSPELWEKYGDKECYNICLKEFLKDYNGRFNGERNDE